MYRQACVHVCRFAPAQYFVRYPASHNITAEENCISKRKREGAIAQGKARRQRVGLGTVVAARPGRPAQSRP
jgi:hypothetical protein